MITEYLHLLQEYEEDNLNLVDFCLSIDCPKKKISCLNILKLMNGGNPQYTTIIDRYIDDITGNYNPSGEITEQFKPYGGTLGDIPTLAIPTIAVVSLGVAEIIYLGYQIYKYYLSKAARMCRGERFVGSYKDECIAKYKIEALQKEIQFIRSKIANCVMRKHSDMCKERLMNRIRSREEKIKNIKKSL